jgi:ATP:corrinoid adenosyltransferase
MSSEPRRGLVIVNTGDGKGKSSSAFGVMLRAVARGWKVIVIQFIKSDKWQTGERKMVAEGEYDLVILDEATYPVSFDWIPVDEVVAAINSRPAHTNVIITGRDADEALIEIADTVTEMKKVKHIFDEGVPARKGLDF